MPQENAVQRKKKEGVHGLKIKIPEHRRLSRADAMREARLNAGLTLRELGKLSGVEFGTIGRLEQGRNNGSITTIEILADALGLSIDEYTGHEVLNESVDSKGQE